MRFPAPWPRLALLSPFALFAAAAVSVTPGWAQPVSATPSAAPDRQVMTAGGQTFEFLRVPGGSFTQGSPTTEPGRGTDENPRTVRLTRDFGLQVGPVTRGQFAAFVAATQYRTEAEVGDSGGYGLVGQVIEQRPEFTWRSPGFPQTDAHPVVLLTFADASAFAAWVSRETGYAVRLPTEAEFEWAARRALPPDATALPGYFKDTQPLGTRAVGERPADAAGFSDLVGHVWTWCADVYGPYGPADATDPVGSTPPAGEPVRRVLRGGSFLKDPRNGRPASRFRSTPGTRNADVGLRLAFTWGERLPVAAAPASGASNPATAGRTSPPPPQGSNLPLGFMVLGPLVGVGAIAWALTRRKGAAAAATPRTGEGSVELRPDGFVYHLPGGRAGQRARFRGVIGGQPATREFDLAGPETFVYTGDRPERMAVLLVAADELANTTAAAVPRSTSHTVDDDPPFRGYPGAY
ncbi:formylglycine-generating enzyme family protein [Myxococcota bacterium]|nr:formylglycine-generating enzyme family protein [Myxococcota bacterium]